MKPRERDDALRLAAVISDGSEIDWSAERREGPSLTETVRRMRLVQDIAAAHRALHPATEEPPTLPARAAELDTTRTARMPPTADTGDGVWSGMVSWGPLQVLERLGRGGFGEVFRAFDPTLQRELALKLLRPEIAGGSDMVGDRLIEEARRMARVRHENIVVIHGADRHDGRPGFWMDLLRGRTLEDLLTDQGPLGSQEAAHVGLSVCRALAAVHQAGLVHRDVKTSNIMREAGGRIVLMDFGSGVEAAGAGRVAPESPSGTPLFMAPELLHGEAASAATDLYALGVVLYRLVTGRFPIEAATYSDLVSLHEAGAAIPLRDRRADLPTAFVKVVEQAIATDPQKRFAGAGAMEAALATAVDVVPAVPHPIDTNRRIERRRLLWAGFAAAVLLAAAGAAAWHWVHPGPLDVDANLYRIGDGSDEKLRDGGRVRPGDQLYLELDATSAVHVYVLNSDLAGSCFVLFPAPGLDLKNPLPPGRSIRLPGRGPDGRPRSWEVTSAGGRETFLVIASRHALDELERDIAQFQRVAEDREITYAPIGDASRNLLRGIGGLESSDSASGGDANDPLRSITSRIDRKAAGRGDVWIWRIELQNPGAS